jgi:hypothetical protein
MRASDRKGYRTGLPGMIGTLHDKLQAAYDPPSGSTPLQVLPRPEALAAGIYLVLTSRPIRRSRHLGLSAQPCRAAIWVLGPIAVTNDAGFRQVVESPALAVDGLPNLG